jgi:hypothetical protein
MSMTIGEAYSAMTVVRHLMNTTEPLDLDETLRNSLQVLQHRAYRTLASGVTDREMEGWLAGG